MITTRETGASAVSARPAPLSTNQGRAVKQLPTASRGHLYIQDLLLARRHLDTPHASVRPSA
jgi:hypothetical protein